MAHGTARKLTRAATLSLLVFATTSGVAGIEVLAASPAIAQPDQGSPFGPGQQQQPSDPSSPGNCGRATRDRAVEPSRCFTLDARRNREGSALRVDGVAASDHRQGS